MTYRGRIAPTPTGDMHVGHARTFVTAWRRAEDAGGALVLRIEDLDPLRCRATWTERAIEDLAWLGVRWTEGPHYQSRAPRGVRGRVARAARRAATCTRATCRGARCATPRTRRTTTRRAPSRCSRRRCGRRPAQGATPSRRPASCGASACPTARRCASPTRCAARRRSPPAWTSATSSCGARTTCRPTSSPSWPTTSRWGSPKSCAARTCSARPRASCCVYRALGAPPPAWCHLPLVRDAEGRRLAKRHAPLSVRELRARGLTPARGARARGARRRAACRLTVRPQRLRRLHARAPVAWARRRPAGRRRASAPSTRRRSAAPTADGPPDRCMLDASSPASTPPIVTPTDHLRAAGARRSTPPRAVALAPSATRTPISRVRRATVNDITA